VERVRWPRTWKKKQVSREKGGHRKYTVRGDGGPWGRKRGGVLTKGREGGKIKRGNVTTFTKEDDTPRRTGEVSENLSKI